MNAENLVPRGWNFCQMLRDQSLGDLDNLPEPGWRASGAFYRRCSLTGDA